jgi:hypothetical protein
LRRGMRSCQRLFGWFPVHGGKRGLLLVPHGSARRCCRSRLRDDIVSTHHR